MLKTIQKMTEKITKPIASVVDGYHKVQSRLLNRGFSDSSQLRYADQAYEWRYTEQSEIAQQSNEERQYHAGKLAVLLEVAPVILFLTSFSYWDRAVEFLGFVWGNLLMINLAAFALVFVSRFGTIDVDLREADGG